MTKPTPAATTRRAPTPGQRAMLRSRYSEAQVAKRLGIQPETLRTYLRTGFPSYHKAQMAAAHIGCGISEVAPFATLLARGASGAAVAASGSGSRRSR